MMHPNGMPARALCVVDRFDRSARLLASLQDAALSESIAVVSLTLNHRLIALMPSASDPSL
jgi:hypothetical protein